MIDKFNIAGYARISVDDELNKDNVSIENQKDIIKSYVKEKFPHSTLTFFEDRDRSGYTFDQREGYQAMRKGLLNGQYDILIVKDFSRFSRRNGHGLVELECLRDAGRRIISISDDIDYPSNNDWLKIGMHFLFNQMPVEETSKKVKAVIKRRQTEGKWICAAPYGYLINKNREFEVIPTEADIVRKIFELYNSGWGYKRISNYLTEQGVATPRMSERMRREAAGDSCVRGKTAAWAIATVQEILDNDFYIGTFRQGKYTRVKINGKDVKCNEQEHIVIENHHQPIIDYRTFAITRRLRQNRTRSNYRGVRKYDNAYSGFLFCGDCGSPMFSMSRKDLAPAYTCGTYHRRGRSGCTSHHIRVDKLDELLKIYVQRVKDNSTEVLERLNMDIENEREDVAETEQTADTLTALLEDLREELKVTKRQRIREIMKKPEQEALIEETYDELESDLQRKIDGLNSQIDLLAEKRNTIIQVNRVAKTALDIFDDILGKEKLDQTDIELVVEKIVVFEDHIEVKLQADIDFMLRSGELPKEEGTVENFKQGTEDILQAQLVQSATKRKDKVYRVNVINDGDPLEIYTDKEGGVIFKKYSLMGGLADFSGQMCETLNKTTGQITVITDRDTCLSAAGCARRELVDKRISPELEAIMEGRQIYQYTGADNPLPVCEEEGKYLVLAAAPILSEGDVLGCVLFASTDPEKRSGEIEYKLAQTIAGFLGRHMES